MSPSTWQEAQAPVPLPESLASYKNPRPSLIVFGVLLGPDGDFAGDHHLGRVDHRNCVRDAVHRIQRLGSRDEGEASGTAFVTWIYL